MMIMVAMMLTIMINGSIIKIGYSNKDPQANREVVFIRDDNYVKS